MPTVRGVFSLQAPPPGPPPSGAVANAALAALFPPIGLTGPATPGFQHVAKVRHTPFHLGNVTRLASC